MVVAVDLKRPVSRILSKHFYVIVAII